MNKILLKKKPFSNRHEHIKCKTRNDIEYLVKKYSPPLRIRKLSTDRSNVIYNLCIRTKCSKFLLVCQTLGENMTIT